MKKTSHLLPALLISTLFVCFLLQPMIALAEATLQEQGTTDNSGAQFNGNVTGSNENSIGSSEFEVKARTTGGPEIVYSITIEYGAMLFEYDYGSIWNPTTHEYTYGTNYRQQGGWVVDGYVDDINNHITITNNSNFPVETDFSFELGGTPLNADPTAEQSVIGIFSNEIGFLGNHPDVLIEGYNGTHTNSMTTSSLTLEMDRSNITESGQFYYKKAAAPASGSYSGSIYFALSGIPDPSGPSAYQSVGTITVSITPAKGVTRVDIP